jgi:hypothetical protein
MTYKVLDTKIIFGSNITHLMEGVQIKIKEGWMPFGTPTPVSLTAADYGMMQIVAKEV